MALQKKMKEMQAYVNTLKGQMLHKETRLR